MSQIDIFEEIIVDNFAGGGGASTGIRGDADYYIAAAIFAVAGNINMIYHKKHPGK